MNGRENSQVARFRLVWEAASDAMALSDPDGIVLDVNPAYCRLYGHPAEDLVGRHFAIVFPPELREPASARYLEVFRAPEIEPAIEVTLPAPGGGSRVVESRYSFLEEGGRRAAMLSIIRDLTERQRAEDARAELARLEGAILTTREVAHRLNNLLTLTLGHLDLLSEVPDLPAPVRSHVESALEGLTLAGADLKRFQHLVRFRTWQSPIGPALDLDRSSEGST